MFVVREVGDTLLDTPEEGTLKAQEDTEEVTAIVLDEDHVIHEVTPVGPNGGLALRLLIVDLEVEVLDEQEGVVRSVHNTLLPLKEMEVDKLEGAVVLLTKLPRSYFVFILPSKQSASPRPPGEEIPLRRSRTPNSNRDR